MLQTTCHAASLSIGKEKAVFTKKYNITKLVFFECGDDINTAIAREKQIKGGSRKKKIDLINSMNPRWKDLFEEYFGNN